MNFIEKHFSECTVSLEAFSKESFPEEIKQVWLSLQMNGSLMDEFNHKSRAEALQLEENWCHFFLADLLLKVDMLKKEAQYLKFSMLKIVLNIQKIYKVAF